MLVNSTHDDVPVCLGFVPTATASSDCHQTAASAPPRHGGPIWQEKTTPAATGHLEGSGPRIQRNNGHSSWGSRTELTGRGAQKQSAVCSAGLLSTHHQVVEGEHKILLPERSGPARGRRTAAVRGENRSERNVNQAHASVNLTEAGAQANGTIRVKRAEDVSSLVPLPFTG